MRFVAFRERWQRSEVLTEQTADHSGHLPSRPVSGPEGLLAGLHRLTVVRMLSGTVWVAGHWGFLSCPGKLRGRARVQEFSVVESSPWGAPVVGRVTESWVPPIMEESGFLITCGPKESGIFPQISELTWE